MQNPESNPNSNPPAVENNYSEHKQNPGPSSEAVHEDDKKGAGQTLRWIIPIILVLLLIVWFFFK